MPLTSTEVAGMVVGAALLALMATAHFQTTGQESATTPPYRLLAPSGDAPHPAVLLVPGCSGFVARNGVNRYDERAAELQAAGYFVVFVDYLDRRKVDSCAHVSATAVGSEILDAAAWARAQSGVDASSISVIGWSYGGGGVLAALAAMPPEPPSFAKAAMYYPDCRGAKPWSAAGVSALMLMAGNDDVARPALCDAVVTGAPAGSLHVLYFPDAHHAFDVRSLPPRAQYPFGTLGYNAEADAAAWAAVLDLLK